MNAIDIRRNPFVNQVVCFLIRFRAIYKNQQKSQSLRKSGRLFPPGPDQGHPRSDGGWGSQSLRKSGRLFRYI